MKNNKIQELLEKTGITVVAPFDTKLTNRVLLKAVLPLIIATYEQGFCEGNKDVIKGYKTIPAFINYLKSLVKEDK